MNDRLNNSEEFWFAITLFINKHLAIGLKSFCRRCKILKFSDTQNQLSKYSACKDSLSWWCFASFALKCSDPSGKKFEGKFLYDVKQMTVFSKMTNSVFGTEAIEIIPQQNILINRIKFWISDSTQGHE